MSTYLHVMFTDLRSSIYILGMPVALQLSRVFFKCRAMKIHRLVKLTASQSRVVPRLWKQRHPPTTAAVGNTFGAMRTILVVPGSRITICHPEENVIGLHSPMWPEVPHHRDICHGRKRTLYLSALGVSFWLWMLVACFNTSLPAHFALLLPLQRMDGPN